MNELRSELLPVLAALLTASEQSNVLSLDAIGEALGSSFASTDDIDLLLALLEAEGREIVGPAPGGGEERLKRVVRAAAELTRSLGRKPHAREVAERAGLSVAEVGHALALLRVMQR